MDFVTETKIGKDQIGRQPVRRRLRRRVRRRRLRGRRAAGECPATICRASTRRPISWCAPTSPSNCCLRTSVRGRSSAGAWPWSAAATPPPTACGRRCAWAPKRSPACYRRTEAEMPGGKKDRELAKEEGAKYRFLTQPVRFIAGPDGRVSGVECLAVRAGRAGQERPPPPRPDRGLEFHRLRRHRDPGARILARSADRRIDARPADAEVRLIVADKETGATSRPACTPAAMTSPDRTWSSPRSPPAGAPPARSTSTSSRSSAPFDRCDRAAPHRRRTRFPTCIAGHYTGAWQEAGAGGRREEIMTAGPKKGGPWGCLISLAAILLLGVFGQIRWPVVDSLDDGRTSRHPEHQRSRVQSGRNRQSYFHPGEHRRRDADLATGRRGGSGHVPDRVLR